MLPSPKTSFAEAIQHKLIAPEELEAFVNSLREQGFSVATLNGSFDLIHAGHLEIIHQASHQADCLIVALNSDASIQAYKGSQRPIVPLKYRLQLIAALENVDWVTWFEETDPRTFLEKVRPNVHVNGAEYGENCIEAQLIRSQGGRLHLVERIEGLATSEIIHKIRALP